MSTDPVPTEGSVPSGPHPIRNLARRGFGICPSMDRSFGDRPTIDNWARGSGFASGSSFVAQVDDGLLEIDVRRHANHAMMSAIEIERVP